MRLSLFASVAAMLLAAGTVFAQNSRRDRENPELVVEPGGRMGACDSLQFTKDGKYLLAVGDDKVVRIWRYVRIWKYDTGLLQKIEMHDSEQKPVLRWSVWREQRGAIFALALSPDDEYVAIAGIGAKNGEVAVLKLSTGKMEHHAIAIPPKGEQVNTIWSMAYAPDGQSVAFGDFYGGVWTWDFKQAPRHLGKHPSEPIVGTSNIVRFVHFFNNQTLVSVAENGTALHWDPTKPIAEPEPMATFGANGRAIYRVALSPDNKWFAAAMNPAQNGKPPCVVLRKADGSMKNPIEIPLDKNESARAIAFNPDSNRLAVSLGKTVPTEKGFFMENEDHIVFYDLDGKRVEPDGPRGIYQAWFLAFHPNKKDLAIAGGDNNEVRLWNLADMKQPVSVMDGAGKSLWGVALSPDGKQIAFRDQRDPQSTDPNDRAKKDPWRVFDLLQRKLTISPEFKLVDQFRSWKEWTVKGKSAAPNIPMTPFIWYVVTPDGVEQKIPLDAKLDLKPLCWTFLPPADGRPLRLAVGHMWGLSIFELSPNTAPKRVRLCTGHQGFVTALAATADGSFLVSASTDQTISGWNLATKWEGQHALGISFDPRGKKLFVKKVDFGSPGWEAGLLAGDEVKEFWFDGDKKDQQEWLERLQNPVPGKEHFFVISRGGQELRLLTTIRQRPLWRFFPTRANEWVLWMWQGSYYDTSAKGDSYIGWVVNSANENREPDFYRVEQFRAIYERPDVLDKLLETYDIQAALAEALENQLFPFPSSWFLTQDLKAVLKEVTKDSLLPPKFNLKEPPFAALKLGTDTTNANDVQVTLTATPHGTNPDYQPERVELWINDFRFVEDKQPTTWDRDGTAFRKSLTIPNKVLRPGNNVVTFQVYNRTGGRAEAVASLRCTRPPLPPQLWGLAVGVNDYKKVTPGPGGRGKLVNLESARGDAEEIRKSWQAQTGLYKRTDLFLQLDGQANHTEILAALDDLAKKVGPEDCCVIFLAGHGTFLPKPTKAQPAATLWLFCCPDFNVQQPEETSISSEDLYRKLAQIKGHKVVILDACHSGVAVANPVRALVPGGQGPIIIAACDRNQSAFEDPKTLKHGLFTYALLQVVEGKYNPDGKKDLDAYDLWQYTQQQMPKLLKDLTPPAPEYAQRPIKFAPDESEQEHREKTLFKVVRVKE